MCAVCLAGCGGAARCYVLVNFNGMPPLDGVAYRDSCDTLFPLACSCLTPSLATYRDVRYYEGQAVIQQIVWRSTLVSDFPGAMRRRMRVSKNTRISSGRSAAQAGTTIRPKELLEESAHLVNVIVVDMPNVPIVLEQQLQYPTWTDWRYMTCASANCTARACVLSKARARLASANICAALAKFPFALRSSQPRVQVAGAWPT